MSGSGDRNRNVDDKLVAEIKEKMKTGGKGDKQAGSDPMLDRARNMDWRNPEEVKEYLDNLYVEFTFQCFNEKKADGCHRLANYMENIRGQFKEATELYKRTCDEYKYRHSCITYAKNMSLGRGCKADMVESCKYNLISCELGADDGCYNAGLCAQEGFGGLKKSTQDSIKYFQRSCDLNYSKGCLRLFKLYLDGSKSEDGAGGVKRDARKAFEYAKRACDLDDIYGCGNASVMLRKGDGIKQDLAEADKYRKRAEELIRAIDPTREHTSIVFGEQHK